MDTLLISRESIKGVNFSPMNLAEEIIQNIWCLLSTIKGEMPLIRDFGISNEALDKPYIIACMYYKIAVQEAIEKYEKRAEVVEVRFDNHESNLLSGILEPIVEVKIKDEYLT